MQKHPGGAEKSEVALTPPLGCFLFHSEIASDVSASCVADITRASRFFNESHNITGVLIFDGLRFVQYIEGPQQQVTALAQKISSDTRHTNFTPQYCATKILHRLFADWTIGYLVVEDSEPLAQMWLVDGEAAISCLQQLLPMLDVA